MSLNAPLVYFIPEETERVAKAAFPKGNRYLRLRDTLGPLFHNPDFQDLFSHEGRPAVDPARLAMITVMQFAERLSDTQAADAVRSRIDWKYMLALPLTDCGFDSSVLSEFRTRLLEGEAEHLLFDTLLAQFREAGLLRARGRQRSDSTHVLAAVRALNRMECVGETMRHALNSLAVVVPDWLVSCIQPSHPDWLERYGSRIEDYHLPESNDERVAYATLIGADGLRLLRAIDATDAPSWLREIPAVRTLRRVWIQNYTWAEHKQNTINDNTINDNTINDNTINDNTINDNTINDNNTLRWRTNEEIPPSGQFIGSPYDLDARYSKKGNTTWVGYKIHLTESCDDDLPHLITNVQTTTATTSDDSVTGTIHQSLHGRDLLPAIHLADTGFIDAELLVESKEQYKVQLYGPVRLDHRRQAREGKGFACQDFTINWEEQCATCPTGCKSINWTKAIDNRTNDVIKIKFSRRDCMRCEDHDKCTDAPRRTITVRPQAQYEALRAGRIRQESKEFKQTYAKRAGIEGTISQGVRVCSVRRARYMGLAKTRLQHLAVASVRNVM